MCLLSLEKMMQEQNSMSKRALWWLRSSRPLSKTLLITAPWKSHHETPIFIDYNSCAVPAVSNTGSFLSFPFSFLSPSHSAPFHIVVHYVFSLVLHAFPFPQDFYFYRFYFWPIIHSSWPSLSSTFVPLLLTTLDSSALYCFLQLIQAFVSSSSLNVQLACPGFCLQPSPGSRFHNNIPIIGPNFHLSQSYKWLFLLSYLVNLVPCFPKFS